MKNISRFALVLVALAAFGGIFAPRASAAPIFGDIDFNGVVTFDSMSLDTATKVQTWNSSFVTKRSGDFTLFTTVGQNVTMAPSWTFNPSTATPGLWSVGGFTFDLNSSFVVQQSSTILNVTGLGIASGNGYDPTPGTWSFTVSRANGQDATTFSFASNTAVPEPGTWMLLATGALGFAGLRFSRKVSSRKKSTHGKRFVKLAAMVAVAAGIFGAGLAPTVEAAPVSGDIDFGGDVSFDTMSLLTAKTVNLWNSAFVLQANGDYTGFVSPGNMPTMAEPWVFNPSTATPALWSVGGFTFNLTSAAILSQSAQFLNIQGYGTITGNSYDPTAAVWTFTANRSDGGMSNSFSFQSQTSPIPEPGSVVFLSVAGLLLLGAFFWRRAGKSTLRA